jgi:hypothetical protein
MRTSLAAAASVLALLSVAAPAWATFTTYATRAEWAGAVGPFEVEDFETTPLQTNLCTDYQGSGCTHEVTIDAPKLDIVIPVGGDSGAFDGIFANGLINGTREWHADLHAGVLIAGTSYNTIVFPQPILAFAVDLARVFDFDFNCELGICGDPLPFPMTFTIGGEDFAVAYGAGFFGVSSTTPFSSLVIRHTDPTEGYLVNPSLDDISFVPVPEPTTAALLALGLALQGLRSRAASCVRICACAARVSG